MKNLIVFFALLILPVSLCVYLSGCELIDGDDPFESLSFKYVYALPNNSGGYTIVGVDSVACAGVPANASLTLLTAVIQNQTDFFNAMANCGGLFLVAGDAVREVKDNGLFFSYRVTGSNNDALIRADRIVLDDPLVDPAGINITTSGGLVVDTPTTVAEMEINYFDPQKVFMGEGGGPVWSQNTNHQNAVFFEMELTEQESDRVEGFFQCIARNQTDPTDQGLLLILDGAFTMVPR